MSTIDPKLLKQFNIKKTALKSLSEYSRTLKIELINGEIRYVNRATGESSTVLEEALDSIDRLGLVDFREISAVDASTLYGTPETVGLNQLAGEVKVVNQYLSDAVTDTTKRQALMDLELGHLVGKQIGARFYKSSTKDKSVISEIDAKIPVGRHAVTSVTDEGYTIIEYFADQGAIPGSLAKRLQEVTGASPVQTSFLQKLMSKGDWNIVAKYSKRLQSYVSPRNVSIGETQIEEFIDSMNQEVSITLPDGRVITKALPKDEAEKLISQLSNLGFPFQAKNIRFEDTISIPNRVSSQLEAMLGGSIDLASITAGEDAPKSAAKKLKSSLSSIERAYLFHGTKDVTSIAQWQREMMSDYGFSEAEVKLAELKWKEARRYSSNKNI